ncbi:response regulator transcription factor [Thermosediminibacter oceani]|nr:response regulator [Thermosediminibacter oceani]
MLKLIIADDEPIVREGLKESVNWDELGLRVVGCARDGREALEIFTSCGCDVILTDIRMPFMSGLELTGRVKEIDPSVIVVLLSAYDEFRYAQEAIRLGAFDYILKPIDLDELKKTMEKAVRKKQEMLDSENRVIPQLNREDMEFFKPESSRFPLKMEEELAKAVKRADGPLALEIFQRIWDEFCSKNYSLEFLKRWGFELVAIITRSVIEIGENVDILFKNTDPWAEISRKKSKEELYGWMKDLIEIICECIGLNKNVRNKKLVEEVVRIIKENYHDKNLTLNSIAERLYITPNYLSTLFKTEMGQGFCEYLTEYRVERAKEMLKDVRLRIYEISDAVGYTDPHYFSKIFKSITGLTPREYREKIL